MELTEWVILLVVAVVTTLAFVPVAKRLAVKLDAIDYPSDRRVNERPVPRLGGLAMMFGLTCALLAYVVGVYCFGWSNDFLQWRDDKVNLIGVGFGILFMFMVGAVDDVIDLRPRYKFLGQIIAACIVAGSGLLFSSFHNPIMDGYVEFGVWAYPITVFYLVAFANVINLIDGLDGLAAGIVAISAATLFALSALTEANAACILSVMLFGVCVAFLRYNYHPASIFMGDSGALTLGMLLAVISLFGTARTAMLVSLLVPVIAAGVPITDTAIAIIRRKMAHRPIGEADKGHIHHRLMQAGFSQRQTVGIMWAWTAALSICALLMMQFDGAIRWTAFFVVLAITAFGIFKLKLLSPVLMHHYSPHGSRKAGKLTETSPDQESEQGEGEQR